MKSMENMTDNMKLVYSILRIIRKCTIFDLQKITKLGDVDMCTTLGYLIKCRKIYPVRENGLVYYTLT